jgi:hypothetical protein
MELRTIETKVHYTLNETGRFAIAKLGYPAQAKQTIILDMPLDAEGLQIDNDGNGFMGFEYTYKPELISDTDAMPQKYGPVIWKRFAKIYSRSTYGLSSPLLSVQDVLNLVAQIKSDTDDINIQVVKKQVEYDIEYEQKVEAQKLEYIEKEAVAKAKEQLKKEDVSIQKLSQISKLISNKSRVRTRQIRDIIDG